VEKEEYLTYFSARGSFMLADVLYGWLLNWVDAQGNSIHSIPELYKLPL
jgi:hypothetical protein